MRNKKIILALVMTVFTGVYIFFTFLNKTEIKPMSSTTNQNSNLIVPVEKAKEQVLIQPTAAQVLAESTGTVAKNVNEVTNQQKPTIDPESKRQLLSNQKVFVR